VSPFREAVLLVLKELAGIDDPPAAYLEDIERLQRAASAWHRLHSAERGPLQFRVPDLRTGTLVTGNLDLAIPSGWAGNDATRHFLRFLDEQTERRCTLLMLQVLILIQQAAGPGVNSRGGAA